MARERTLQVRLAEEEWATIEGRSGPRKVSDYMRTAALDGIAPDVASDLRSLLRLASQGGQVGEAAKGEILSRVARLCKVEST